MKACLALVAVLALAATPALADVRLPHIFSDHMALQSVQPVPVWGWADPNETVTVRFERQTQKTRAGADGHWQVVLKPMEPASEAEEMTVKGAKNTVIIADVVVGEVWLASGQSNMEKPIGEQRGQKPTFNAEDELKAGDHPDIRLFKVAKTKSATPRDDVEGAWVRCDPASLEATKFSAAAYFFGRKLEGELKRPVGLIDSTWGGTRIEPWTPPSGFKAVPSLTAFDDNSQAAKLPGGTAATALYNGMIAPLVPFALRGAIWYQGESNILETDDGDAYADKMTALVEGWRGEWKSQFPFYYVQIAPHLYHVVRPNTVAYADAEPRLWEAQAASLRLPDTGMVVTTDLVDDLFDIHPRDKKTVGERLANLALAGTYGHTGLETSGPMFRTMSIADGKAVLTFDHAEGLAARDAKPLTWFMVAGTDGRFWPATAVIDGEHIIVSSPNVPQPVTVHFAWDEGAQSNLVNAAGLPAVPFRSDNPFLSGTAK